MAKVNLFVLRYTNLIARVLQCEILIKDLLLLLFFLLCSLSACVQLYLTVCEEEQMLSRGLSLFASKVAREIFLRHIHIR